ncbi:polysaccharide deacetylase family protein [Nonomuraea terrae]|uniref:Polysaccharide deacetylase family protein n=1 Tax=Nonomuraea terrae TaxID=2530383 RepID=A0A4R4ZH10_9ACTN|nr:polysaccharide deacetylase family protein [Nonomuraea terrae]TDD55852.1 polysaccharide deacetylase family protein [Nonomuraea terrae]
MHKARFFSGIALLALSASGCGLAAASPGKHVMVPAEPTMIDFVDPATVAGLSVGTLTEGDSPGNRYAHVNYPVIAAAPALNKALRVQAERQLANFNQRTEGRATYPRVELNVDWQLPTVSSQAIGVRLRTGEYVGADWGNSMRTFWFDPRTGETVGSTGLLAGERALEKLTAVVREQLDERGSQVEQESVTANDDVFDSMAFNRSGDLVVEFDDCQIGPCSLGRLAVAVPRDQAAPLLSDLGRRAQTAVREAAQRVTPYETPRMVPPADPDAVSSRAGSVDCSVAKCVALTFEDGPGMYTGRLLDVLDRQKARATFFVLGANAVAQPALLHRMSEEGHLVGGHSWSHRDLSKQTSSKIAESLRLNDAAVSAALGQTPRLLRPPYGSVSPALVSVATRMGLSLVTGDVDTKDESGGDPGDIADRAVRGAHPGAIILMHDIHRESVDAVPDILKRLRGKGYTFVTVPELYGVTGMQAGRLYRSGSELPVSNP